MSLFFPVPFCFPVNYSLPYEATLAGFVIVSIQVRPFATICCVLTHCQEREQDNDSKGREEEKIRINRIVQPARPLNKNNTHTGRVDQLNTFCLINKSFF